jgi:hypothetical protein
MRSSRVVALLIAVSLPAPAAHVTDVADAGGSRPFELDLEATYVHSRQQTRIRRENLQGGNIVLVDELDHSRTVDETDFRLAIGAGHGFELHVVAPYVIGDSQDWDFATVDGVPVSATSTLTHNTIDVSGCGAPGSCSSTTKPIVVAPGHSQRSGFRDPTVGITWAIFDQAREARMSPALYPPGKPVATWVIGFDYTLPIAGAVDDPSVFGLNAASGNSISTNELRRTHVFSGWTAFSQRIGSVDPYILLRASAGVPIQGSYDNCAHLNLLSNVAPANCAAAAWKSDTRYQPPVQAGFALGSEFVFAEDPAENRKFALDLRGDLTWFSRGRDYTQAADMLGKLTMADEYVSLLGSLGLYGRISRWFQLRVRGVVGYDMPHFLTTEAIGKDLDGNGSITVSSNGGPAPEQNPNYDYRLDQPGRRLKAEAVFLWGVSGTLSLNF